MMGVRFLPLFLVLMLPACTQNSSGGRLLAAAGEGRLTGVEHLLLEGTPGTVIDGRGRTATMLAAEQGRLEVLLFLEDRGYGLVQQRDHMGWSALMYAAAGGHVACVEALVAMGAELDATNQYGNTSLMWAARGGHTEVVSLLLRHGASVGEMNRLGWDAGAIARRFGAPEAAEMIETGL